MNNKVVLITGTSSGIGYALASKFVRQGYKVFGISRNRPSKPYDWTQIDVDISKNEDIKTMMTQLNDKVDTVDILINCAGMGYAGALEDMSVSQMSYMFHVNLFAPLHIINQVLPFLRNSQDPRIINIGSVASEITIPFQTMYSMTKSAMYRMTEGLRMELKPEGIQVITILPGDTKTEFSDNRTLLTKNDSRYYERAKKSIERMEKDEQNGMNVSSVVKLVSKQLKKNKMSVYATVGLKNKLFVLLAHVVPSKIRELIIYKIYAS